MSFGDSGRGLGQGSPTQELLLCHQQGWLLLR